MGFCSLITSGLSVTIYGFVHVYTYRDKSVKIISRMKYYYLEIVNIYIFLTNCIDMGSNPTLDIKLSGAVVGQE